MPPSTAVETIAATNLETGQGENSPNQSSRFEPQNRKPSEIDGLALRGHALAARAHLPRKVYGEEFKTSPGEGALEIQVRTVLTFQV